MSSSSKVQPYLKVASACGEKEKRIVSCEMELKTEYEHYIMMGDGVECTDKPKENACVHVRPRATSFLCRFLFFHSSYSLLLFIRKHSFYGILCSLPIPFTENFSVSIIRSKQNVASRFLVYCIRLLPATHTPHIHYFNPWQEWERMYACESWRWSLGGVNKNSFEFGTTHFTQQQQHCLVRRERVSKGESRREIKHFWTLIVVLEFNDWECRRRLILNQHRAYEWKKN